MSRLPDIRRTVKRLAQAAGRQRAEKRAGEPRSLKTFVLELKERNGATDAQVTRFHTLLFARQNLVGVWLERYGMKRC